MGERKDCSSGENELEKLKRQIHSLAQENRRLTNIIENLREKDLTCPITQVTFKDPVTTADGHTYERADIEKWFARGKRTSPNTGATLRKRCLRPNHLVKSIVNTLREKGL